MAETNTSINLRLVIGKRIGVASTNRTDDDSLRRLASPRPHRAAPAGAAGLHVPAGAGPDPRGTDAWAAATAESTHEERAEAAVPSSPPQMTGVLAYGSYATDS